MLAASPSLKSSAPGPGLCSTAVHLSFDFQLTSPEVAQFYLSQPVGTNGVDGKTQFLAPTINFHNGDPAAASTDYANPQPLPFSSLSGSAPLGNDRDLALRSRGYVDITRSGTFTFAVQADDGYSLLVAGLPVLRSTVMNASVRDSQQVQFASPGLYAVELTYYKNSGAAVLDLAVADRADAVVASSGQPLGSSFALANQTAASALYPTLAGTTDCTECTSDTVCGAGAGRYCRDGLCQACVLDSHCGPSCTACDVKGQICLSGQCSACTSDAQCGSGKTCDTAFGQCIARPSLTYAGGCSSSGSSAPSSPVGLGLLLGLLTLGALLRRRGSLRSLAAVAVRPQGGHPFYAGVVVGVAASLVGASAAEAQSATPTVSFNTQTFHPAIGPGNAFAIDGTLMPRRLWPLGGVLFEYANQPLRAVLSGGQTYATTVSGMLTAHVMPGFSLASWAFLALDLPVVLYQGFDSRTPTTDVPNTPSALGIGDLRIVGKFRLVDNNDEGGIGLALVTGFTAPTGSDAAFRGDNTFGVEPRLVLDYRFREGTFRGGFIAINASYYARTYNRNVDFGLVRVSDQVRYGVGLGLPLPKNFGLLAEVNGAVGVSQLAGGPLYAPIEGLVGVRWAHASGIEVSVGGGGAFRTAVGIPNLRLMAGVSYSLPQKAVVKATRVDPDDLPPPVRQPDSDGDGIPDAKDKCPESAGPASNRGCPVVTSPPPEPTKPSDTPVPTPTKPAVVTTAPAGSDGDRDKDGVPDSADKCVDQAGPVENSGCPDADSDGDGVVDRLDKCPSKAGPKESGGCPAVVIGDDSITLGQPIRFKSGDSKLEPASVPTVIALGKAILADESVQKVGILVGASGDRKAAKKLAGQRAKFLRDALTNVGVAKKKLVVKVDKASDSDEVSTIKIKKAKVKGAKVKAAADDKAAADEPADGKKKHHRRKKKDE